MTETFLHHAWMATDASESGNCRRCGTLYQPDPGPCPGQQIEDPVEITRVSTGGGPLYAAFNFFKLVALSRSLPAIEEWSVEQGVPIDITMQPVVRHVGGPFVHKFIVSIDDADPYRWMCRNCGACAIRIGQLPEECV